MSQVVTTINRRFISAQHKGIFIALLGAVLMSFDPIFIKSSGVSGLDAAFLFGFFTSVSMLGLLSIRAHNGLTAEIAKNGKPLWISSALIFISASSLVISLKYTSVTNTFVILCAAPAITAIFSRIILKEMTGAGAWLIIAIVMIGVGIVVAGSLNSVNVIGDGLALLSVLSISFNQTYLRKHQNVSRIATIGLAGLMIASTLIWFVNPESYGIKTWLIMATMGLFTAPVGRVLSQIATRYITATEVGVILVLEAALAPFLAYIFFKEQPTHQSLIGGSVIFIAIIAFIIHSNNQVNRGA